MPQYTHSSSLWLNQSRWNWSRSLPLPSSAFQRFQKNQDQSSATVHHHSCAVSVVLWLHLQASFTLVGYLLDGYVGQVYCSSSLTQHTITSRPRWALCSLFLIDSLRARGITTAYPFTRIPSTRLLKQSRASTYGNAHTGVLLFSAGHPSNTNFITSHEAASRISSSRLSGMSANTLTH